MRGSWSDTSGCEAAHAAATAPPTLALNGLGDVSVNKEDQRREDTKWLRVEQYLSACERRQHYGHTETGELERHGRS